MITRLFLVDSHPTLRAGLRAVLSGYPDLLVVGEAANGLELADQLADQLTHQPPDVVLLDDFEVALRLRQQYPTLRLLVLSESTALAPIADLLAAGVLGCLLKSASLLELVCGVRLVASDCPFLGSSLSLAALWQAQATPDLGAVNLPTQSLSKREQKILALLAQGFTTTQMAEQLFVSPRTVETHRHNILEKTRATNTASLIRYAMQQGWLT